ncbi:hypothetical protein CRYUN_Cryun02cG0063600 [Craigia yunnanensis]
MDKIRRASHAGSWYTDNPKKLAEELDEWIRAAGLAKSSDVRGVIAPHAGYSYSGRAAAYAFGNIDPTNISRVFLLGPSHHYYTPKCALSTATIYKTPIGDLPIDLEVIEELKATGKFELMDLRVDEAEHSMEMHLPYLAKVFEGHPVKVVPILVGALSAENEAMYGKLLAKYVDDPRNFFSVSSDFCHWGSRFNYMHNDKKYGAIHKSIEALDKMGMDIIETGDADAFKQYLLEYENTICGRHPISVFLHMLTNSSTKIKIKFLRYEQSSQCKTMRDSSLRFLSFYSTLDFSLLVYDMSKVTQKESLPPNAVVLDSFVGFALQAMVVETAIVATKSVAWLLMMMGTLPNGFVVFIKEPEAYAGFPLSQLLAVSKPGPENKDASDTEDDDDDDEEDEAADDPDEDEGEEEDGSGEEGEDEGDPEDDPEANGDGGTGDEDDEDDDNDDDDDDDGEEDEEEEEEEEEEELQPPAKKRK